jgi:hypothetical protein
MKFNPALLLLLIPGSVLVCGFYTCCWGIRHDHVAMSATVWLIMLATICLTCWAINLYNKKHQKKKSDTEESTH